VAARRAAGWMTPPVDARSGAEPGLPIAGNRR
jgi:hypothetical protein